MKRVLVVLILAGTGCGARTGLDAGRDQAGIDSGASSGSSSGQSSDQAPFCSVDDGPVDASVPGNYTGRCPPSLRYCVIVPGTPLYGCCPSPQGVSEGCLAPEP
jgi:hypothetical protein